jgi:hypothetical protein
MNSVLQSRNVFCKCFLIFFCPSLTLNIPLLQTFYFDNQSTVHLLLNKSSIIRQDHLYFILFIYFFYNEPVFNELINIDLGFTKWYQ